MKKIQKIIFTLIYTLFVIAAGFAETKTWVGGDSSKPTDWDTPANWSPSGVPTSSDEVVINSGVNQPVIENTVIYTAPATKEIPIKKLTINDNAILTIKSNKIRIKLKCSTGIINNGKIILDLIWSVKKIEFTKTEFKDASEIYIDAPFYGTPVAYDVTLKSSTEIDFKAGSTAVIENGHASERFIIDTPALTAKGTLTIENKLEIKNTHSSAGLNINISGSLTAKKDFIVPDNANTNITSSGTVNLEQSFSFSNIKWNASNGTITTKGNFSVPNFKQTYGSLNLAGGGQNLNIEQAYNLKIESLSTTSLTGNIKILNSFNNNGTFNTGTNNTITFTGSTFTNTGTFTAGTNNTVTIAPSSRTVTITGTAPATNTEFYDLEFTNGGGKTLTINKEIFINHSLKLEGTAINNLLTIEGVSGSSAIKLQNNMSGGKWLNVKTNIPIESPCEYTTTESKPDGSNADLAAGKPFNWVFNLPAALIWTGKVDKNWNDQQNWAPRNPVPTAPTALTNVIIPSGCPKYPELDSEPPLPIYHAKHVTVEKNASLSLKKNIITEKSLDNYDTVYMEGSAAQKAWLAMGNSSFAHKSSSTIIYQNVTAPNAEIWQGPYQNLTFESGVPDTVKAAQLTVNEKFTTGKSIEIITTSERQTYYSIAAGTHNITFKVPSGKKIKTHQNVNAGNIKMTGIWESAGNITSSGSITAESDWTSTSGSAEAYSSITVSGKWDFTGNITTSNGKIEVTGDWNSNNGNITAGTDIEAAKWTSTGGTVNAGNNITVTGAWNSGGTGISATNIEAKKDWISSGNITASGNIKVDNNAHDNKWTSSGNISLRGDLSTAQFDQTGGILTFNGTTDQKLEFTGSGEKNINHLTIDSSAKVKLLSTITIKGNLTNNGTFDATITDSPPTGYTVILTNNASHTITGTGTVNNTKFHNLEYKTTVSGKTLTVSGKISVNGDLTLHGKDKDNPLTIAGGHGSQIDLNGDKSGGKWLEVKTNIPIETGTYTTIESKPDGSEQEIYTYKQPKNWIFKDCLIELRWVAEEANDPDKTKWDKPKNWLPSGIPGVQTPVNIPTGINKYPKLESTTNAKAKRITVDGELDLDGYVINDTTNTAPITNNGILKMTGTGDQKTWFEQSANDDKITLGNDSTVQYDSGSSANVFSGAYENLILNRSITTAPSLTVNKKTTVNAAATITVPTQTYGGDVTINANTTFNASNSVTFSQAIKAAANNVTFDGTGTINTRAVTAGDIKLNTNTGAWTSLGAINSSGDITVNAGTGAWTSSGSITAQNITANRNWTSLDNVTANGSITATDWTAKNVTLKGNLTAAKFIQNMGTLTFNGTAQKLNISDTDSIILNLNIESSSQLQLLSSITLISSFVNKGKFDAMDKDVTLKPEDTIAITGTNNETDTKFYNLFCKDAGGKTFKVKDKISVNNDMHLSGSYISHSITTLNVTGENGAVYLAYSQSKKDEQKYLKVWSDNIKINNGNINEKYYVADDSTDENGTTYYKNGWIFFKNFTLVNSFAKPDENKIYLLFEKESTNGKYIDLEENDLAYPKSAPLKILNESGGEYTKNDSRVPKKLSLPSIPENHTFWEFVLDDKISSDWILNKKAMVSFDYFGRPKEKFCISDIGIGMVKPQMAFTSLVLRSFDAKDYDLPLPSLDVRIPTERAASSSNVTLYFRSTDSVQHKFWHPGTAPIGPASHYFAVPQSGTNTYSYTPENNLMNFVIPETDPYLMPEKVGGFMYVYDGWLPCARLRNNQDILSFDVWHFKIVGARKQRGGVSMFNNVINPNSDQNTVLEIDIKKSGFLTIQVMTIDGSIIKTIERDQKPVGRYLYNWDGKNQAGNTVARGIYFIRISGPDIDETRKVLIIR